MAPAFEILGGLPGTGPAPEQFTTHGGTHSEGFVVRVFPRTGATWVGNFQPGFSPLSAVLEHPDGHKLIVIAGGQAYVIDPATRLAVATFGCDIQSALVDADRNQLIFCNGLWFEALGTAGTSWRSRRVSWDDVRYVHIEGAELRGEGWTPMGETWHEFVVDLESGAAAGGAYDGPGER